MAAEDRDRAHVGVALSGGGHRAALFTAGALMALVDMGVHPRIVSVASVSGGSITNGLVARNCDLTATDRAGLEAALAPGIRAFTHDGLFFPGKPTDGFVTRALGVVGLAVGSIVGWVFGALVLAGAAVGEGSGWVIAVVAALVMVGAILLTRSLETRFRIAIVLGLACGLLGVGGGMWWLDGTDVAGWLVLLGGLVAAAGAYLLAVVVMGRRSKVVDAAMHRGLFGEALLPSVDRPAHHVFCATDLLTGNHGYLSPRMAYSYRWGLGRPAAALRLSTAVQASACFPGGFPPRRLRAAAISADPLEIDAVELIDGGVYDNMGDEWEFGWESRTARYGAALASLQPARAGTLIVVNAGGVWQPSALPSWGIRRELAALAKCSGIQHSITTSLRRRFLVERFSNAGDGGLTGALVHIDQSPRRVPERQRPNPACAERAGAALALLDRLGIDAATGDTMREFSTGVGTVLRPLGTETAAALMWHAYLLTRINVYVLLGLGSLPADAPGDWQLERFTRLAGGS